MDRPLRVIGLTVFGLNCTMLGFCIGTQAYDSNILIVASAVILIFIALACE